MLHLTLNTGHTRQSPRDEVSDTAIAALAPTLTPGKHPIEVLPGYTALISHDGSALLVTVCAPGDRPLVTFGVAPDDAAADTLWPELERHYYSLTDLPGLRAADFRVAHRPDKTPWIAAVVIMPNVEESAWLGDYERCVAWAWIEQHRRSEQ